MKKIIYLFTIAFFGLAVSCDRIENPVVNNESILDWNLYPDSDTSTYPWPVWSVNSNTQRNVLLEDYTGHTCVNCPSAAVIAKNIEDSYGGKVIVMSVHASTNNSFQVPEPPELPDDHRTTAGNEYANAMNIGANPLGTVNRVKNGSNYWLLSTGWQNAVDAEVIKSPDFNIQAQYNYYAQTNGLFFHTEVEALNDLSGNFSLINLIVRDTVVAPQKDQGGVLHEDYDHHSMLTNNINGTWGTPIVSGSINTGEKIYNHYSFELPDPSADTTFKVNNISIITLVCDLDDYEVLQVIKTPLAP
ncbi:MAG: Omp28-related outer membrane protein [Flavobacteriales bacterium]|nr:Omp28-related outer membrane protein [Flavobacteriales bacterium]